jgi:hypothetical protein
MVNNITNNNIWCHFSDKHQTVMVNNWLAILLTITVWCLSEKWHHILLLVILLTITVWCLSEKWHHILLLVIIWWHFSDKHQTVMVNNITNHNIWCHFSDKHQTVMVNNIANHNIWCHFSDKHHYC